MAKQIKTDRVNRDIGDNRTKIISIAKSAAGMLIIGGLLFIVLQFFHPADELNSVGTKLWLITGILTSIMSLFIFLGILGSYLLQVQKSGVLTLGGFILFGFFWLVSMIFSFNEAFVLPLLVKDAPDLVSGMVGLFSDSPVSADLGIFPGLAAGSGIVYILGGILYGIGTYKAGYYSRYTSSLLSAASILTLATALVAHPLDRLFAIPMGIALIFLGIEMCRTLIGYKKTPIVEK